MVTTAYMSRSSTLFYFEVFIEINMQPENKKVDRAIQYHKHRCFVQGYIT